MGRYGQDLYIGSFKVSSISSLQISLFFLTFVGFISSCYLFDFFTPHKYVTLLGRCFLTFRLDVFVVHTWNACITIHLFISTSSLIGTTKKSIFQVFERFDLCTILNIHSLSIRVFSPIVNRDNPFPTPILGSSCVLQSFYLHYKIKKFSHHPCPHVQHVQRKYRMHIKYLQ